MLVPEGGYCWVENAIPSRLFGDQNKEKLGPPPHMVINAFLGGAQEVSAKAYFPLLETPGLFRQFRDLELNPDSLLQFANEYGWIGATGNVDCSGRGWTSAVGISTWYTEIQATIVVDHIWKYLQEMNKGKLRKYFRWHPTQFNVWFAIRTDGREIRSEFDRKDRDRKVVPRAEWGQRLVPPNQVDRLKAIGWNHGDVIGPAQMALLEIVNSRLEKYCHPRLYLDARRGFVGHWTPINLLGCIWLQFYLTVIGQLKLRICRVCGKEMDVSQSRSTRRMHERCAKNQRMQRWRAKKKKS
jgi:hypothetical protein